MKRIGIAAVLAALAYLDAGAAEAPEQFRIWGDRAKAHPYLKRAEAAPEKMEAPADIRARGFAVLGVAPSAPLSRYLRPTAPGGEAPLEARDCPGQYGPVAFALHPFADAQCSVAVTDLAGPGGRRIGAGHFDVRVLRCLSVASQGKPAVAPALLESFDRLSVRAGCPETFWITYHVPDDAAPGLYEGKVRIAVGGDERLAIPLRLRVYPFGLVEPPVNLYMYYNSHHAADMAQAEKQLIDQRCHGMSLAPLEMPVTRDGDLPRDAVVPWLDLYAKVGFARKALHVGLWNRITCEWLNAPDKSIGMWGPWFRFYPFGERLDRRYVETVTMLRDEAGKRGLQLVVSVADEAGSHAWTTEATQHYSALLKQKVPGVLRELTVGGGWAMGRPEHDLWKGLLHIWTTNRWLPEKLDLVRQGEPDALIGIYNMGGEGSGAGGVEAVRAMFGFFAWKTRAAGAAQWTYYHSGTPSHNYAWPADDPAGGPVPTVRWELAREGTKDRRYLAALEARLAGATGPAADEARALLDEIAAGVDLRNVDYDAISGGRLRVQPPGTYDAWRDRIASCIARLAPAGR